jgi:WD40 repeat protein
MIEGVTLLGEHEFCSWSRDKTVRIWSETSDEPRLVLEGHSDVVRGALELSEDRLLSWSDDGTLRVWDLQTGQTLRTLSGHSHGVAAAHLSPDGRVVSCPSWPETTLRIWDLSTGETCLTMIGYEFGAVAARVLAENRVVSWSDFEHHVCVWDGQSGNLLTKLEGHTQEIRDVLVLEDGNLLSMSSDGDLRIWDRQSYELVQIAKGEGQCVMGVLELPDSKLFWWTHSESHYIWSRKTGSLVAMLSGWMEQEDGRFEMLEGSRMEIEEVLLLPDGRLLSSNGLHTAYRIWDSQTGNWIGSLDCGPARAYGARLLADRRLLTRLSDHTFKVWDAGEY